MESNEEVIITAEPRIQDGSFMVRGKALLTHVPDNITYCAKKAAAARATEDFMPNEPTFQTLHVAAAFNSLFLGEIVVPDWDMFYSDHFTAEFHGAARTLSGSAVYVSDKPGSHNFDIIKRLVLPDGSILRARLAGRPTRDCLFNDPVTDVKSLLKIWNLNKLSGVIGVFNCQRAGVWPPIRGSIYEPVSGSGTPISGSVSALDVKSLEEVAGGNWRGDCAVYTFLSGSPLRPFLAYSAWKSFSCLLAFRLGTRDHGFIQVIETIFPSLRGQKLWTLDSIQAFGEDLRFAPIGLLDTYNSGGALKALNHENNSSDCKIKVRMRGCGRFGAYSNTKPKSCAVNQKEESFEYSSKDGLLTVKLQGDCNSKEIVFVY